MFASDRFDLTKKRDFIISTLSPQSSNLDVQIFTAEKLGKKICSLLRRLNESLINFLADIKKHWHRRSFKIPIKRQKSAILRVWTQLLACLYDG